MKHFIGYGSTTTGKTELQVLFQRVLRQFDLPIYEAAIKAGAKSVMISSGEINGTPIHSSEYLITDVLKKELGFQGVVTDWKDIIYLHTRHKVAETNRDAVRIAVMAGIDMSMVPKIILSVLIY
jgi:beta-glucosidase